MYVPTGFSPNGDGLNEILRPLALGMRSVDIFMVYNRWGQLMFRTTNIGEGWDGRYGGKEQAPGSYVWYAEGTDYLNRKISRKGSVVLIR
jgi:gliding motility-associated-like protein